jgi:hypothetical protein
MPTRETAPIGAPCWIDLQTSSAERSRDFYGRLFGWTADEPAEQFGGYFTFSRDGVPVAGCMPSQPGDAPTDFWSVYLSTDDAAKTLDAVAPAGGQVVVPAMAVGDLGTMAIVTDAGGAVVGLWQPNQFAGITVLGEPGAPSWFELLTRDYQAAIGFYREVFRWDTTAISDTPELRYTTLRDPGSDGWLAGIMDAAGFLPDGAPAAWSVYIGVDDADATLAKAAELGGSIVAAAQDTPYGRLATAADPAGAQFKLVAPNEAMPSTVS